MKKILIILTLFSQTAFCQKPVQWEVTAVKKTDQTYDLIIKGGIQKGWNVYSEKDKEVDGLNIAWDNANVLMNGEVQVQTDPVVYNDPIFNKKIKVYRQQVVMVVPVRSVADVGEFKVGITGFASKKDEFIPIEESIKVILNNHVRSDSRISSIDITKPVAQCGDKQDATKGLLAIFFLGIGGGLIALLTPCIFPMIPVTVSYFTGKAKTKKQGMRNGILYGLFIFLIYVVLSIPFHLIGNINPQIFNTISTNAWVNVFFFLIFILFALSFFGLFEIKLPSAFANNAGAKSGIFFMALTLVIVSFSCTGIILGSLLVNALSSDGNAWQLSAGMGGFGLALALPFGLFAMFPGWLKNIPKSGGWLNTVKISLAFVELALAIKFLSNADLVEHWGILKREVFIGLWLLIAVGLALYLLGFFEKRNLHQKLSKGRIGMGIVVLAFAVYITPGVMPSQRAHLTLLSGFPPPASYSIYQNISKGLQPDIINDYDRAIALARKENKPLLIDFTGWACVNCRKMEEHVWTKPLIKQFIKDNYILVSLYVDDRKKMKDGKTVGQKWAKFQAENFNQVTQPLYVVLSPDEKLMNYPVGFTPDADAYKAWLECGLNALKNINSL